MSNGGLWTSRSGPPVASALKGSDPQGKPDRRSTTQSCSQRERIEALSPVARKKSRAALCETERRASVLVDGWGAGSKPCDFSTSTAMEIRRRSTELISASLDGVTRFLPLGHQATDIGDAGTTQRPLSLATGSADCRLPKGSPHQSTTPGQWYKGRSYQYTCSRLGSRLLTCHISPWYKAGWDVVDRVRGNEAIPDTPEYRVWSGMSNMSPAPVRQGERYWGSRSTQDVVLTSPPLLLPFVTLEATPLLPFAFAMKSLALVAALAASAMAQYTQRSPSFRLLILMPGNTTTGWNGTVLGACHEGAAIEGLCPDTLVTETAHSYNIFYHNISDSDTSFTDARGVLSYDFYYGENLTAMVPSSMDLVYNPASDTAFPLITPSNRSSTYVSFDECNSMYIGTTQDDRVDPTDDPSFDLIKVKGWWLCRTNFAYRYVTLVWAMGIDTVPANPTCRKVDVKRVFV
ncbi:hypothetical protein BCR34DRAFT_665048 [Clohesyomyces aquaticus]|uniref:Uncharacterized protein n=1 Tax=Clohesyomyces aquaticus TaxID=1231657 RepID=A0A1Y1ZJP2_9PLEO|nr:hypothetical protein BCR34DRAFT_665048 [Clohesyomyces aquaticus]